MVSPPDTDWRKTLEYALALGMASLVGCLIALVEGWL